MKRRYKRSNKELKHFVGSLDFNIKGANDDSDGDLVIRGLANANVVDRGNEIIATDAWNLDNFKKNPVILLNHGFDLMGGLPIGKATAIKPTENGLEIEARISKSDNGPIPMVRDLIKDGYLSTFSVGFDLIEGKEVVEEGREMFLITKAELFEVSVVGVPMNQDSTFTVTQKDFKSMSKKQIEAKLLRQKGCHIQANIMDILHETEFGLTEFLKSMMRRTKRQIPDLKEVMLGNKEPDALFIEKACDFLDTDTLTLYKGNVSVEKITEALEQIKDGADPTEVLTALAKEASDDEDEDDDGKIEDDDKEMSDDEDDEEDKSEDSEDDEEEKENGDDDEEEVEEDKLKDFQDCVNGKIPTLMDEGMEQDQAVASAIESCASEKACDIGSFKNSAFAACFEAADSYKQNGEWTSVDFTEIKQALAEGETGETTPIDTELKEEEGTTDPHLMAANQTNVLLGTMISKFDALLTVMEKQNAEANTEDNSDEDETEAEKSKALKIRIAKARQKQLELQERVLSIS